MRLGMSGESAPKVTKEKFGIVFESEFKVCNVESDESDSTKKTSTSEKYVRALKTRFSSFSRTEVTFETVPTNRTLPALICKYPRSISYLGRRRRSDELGRGFLEPRDGPLLSTTGVT